MHKLLMEIPEKIETIRLVLRAYHRGDGEMYLAVGEKNRQHLRRFEGTNAVLRPTNVDEAEVVVRELELDWAARKSFFLGGFDKFTG